MKFLADQSGSSMLLMGLGILGLLAIGGLVIDGGSLYMTKTHLQKTANAAVLSSAQELTNTEQAVHRVIDEVLMAHQEQSSLTQTTINMEHQVSVTLHKEITLSFATIFGFDRGSVEVKATAQILPTGRAIGVAPLGIDNSIPLEYYKRYKLKVDQTEVEYGYFGILALGGNGAATYEMNLKYGYQNEVKLGDIIDTQTGNIAGRTREGVQEKLQKCPYTPGETTHRDCSRILLIPVYEPYNYHSGQLKQIKVVGFAYFYITEPMNNKDTSITGMFIKRVGSGYSEQNALNKGAFSIKLIESK